MLLRTCSLLVLLAVVLLFVRLSDALVLRERRNVNDYDLYDDTDDVNSEEISNKMYSLCDRLHKRQTAEDLNKRISTPLIMRMCELMSR